MTPTTNIQSDLTTRITSSVHEFRAILPEWKELFLRCPDATPFQRPEWMVGWIESVCPRNLVGVEVRESGRLIGFAPLLIYPRSGEQVLAFAGGGVSDYLGILSEREKEPLVMAEFFDAIHKVQDWTTLDLTDISQDAFLIRCGLLDPHISRHDVCFVLPLPKTVEGLSESLSKRQWANLRNSRSRTQRAGVAMLEVAEPGDAAEFLDDLFRLHGSRWSACGEGGVLGDPKVQSFHKKVAPILISERALRLYRMRLNQNTIASIYCLFEGTRAFCYLQGFDPEFSHLSPGTQLMFNAIEDAVCLGMSSFDFLRGEEAYKLHWNPQRYATYRIQISRNDLGRLDTIRAIQENPYR